MYDYCQAPKPPGRESFDTEYDQAKIPPYTRSLKALLFPPPLNKEPNKGKQGVRERCEAELPPFHCLAAQLSSHIGHGKLHTNARSPMKLSTGRKSPEGMNDLA